MTEQLNILLIDKSSITSVRLVELLRNVKEVKNVFHSKDVRKGSLIFSFSKIDFLVLSIHLSKIDLMALCSLCTAYNCKIIFLSTYVHSNYKTWCKSAGVSYFLDKASETNKIESIIKNDLSLNILETPIYS